MVTVKFSRKKSVLPLDQSDRMTGYESVEEKQNSSSVWVGREIYRDVSTLNLDRKTLVCVVRKKVMHGKRAWIERAKSTEVKSRSRVKSSKPKTATKPRWFRCTRGVPGTFASELQQKIVKLRIRIKQMGRLDKMKVLEEETLSTEKFNLIEKNKERYKNLEKMKKTHQDNRRQVRCP